MFAAIEWNRLLEPPLGAIIFGGLAGIANFSVIGYFWLRAQNARLKQSMVEKGFSASEIERVVLAAPPSRKSPHGFAPVPADGPTAARNVSTA